ncbi:MAG: ParB/RepB/Spo0J family partition protein, partial [Candidatus Tectomicrobia bacterium]|nr:ParB/RepB/Spo0J family partition protein [Candidatus Tectomicrobia bacterium]
MALPLSFVTPDPTQPRKKFSREPLEGLAASIAREGLLQPITVRQDGARFIIVTGERRYRASCIAKTGTIRALVEPKRDAGEVLGKQVLENMVREDMNPIEEAEGMKRLLDAGYSLDEVTRTVGKKPATVERDLELLKLAPEVRHMLTASPEQRMGKRLAYELVKLSHQGQRAVLRKIGGKP